MAETTFNMSITVLCPNERDAVSGTALLPPVYTLMDMVRSHASFAASPRETHDLTHPGVTVGRNLVLVLAHLLTHAHIRRGCGVVSVAHDVVEFKNWNRRQHHSVVWGHISE